MKQKGYTLHDINDSIANSADLYLRTVIINKKRQYIRKITKLSRHGIIILELEKYESNLVYNENCFNCYEIKYFYVKGQYIAIRIPEIAEALSKLPEIHLQVLMQSTVLKIPIADIAKEFNVSKRMINIYKSNAINELRKKLKNYEE